eukprot:scaffold12.g7908.t1
MARKTGLLLIAATLLLASGSAAARGISQKTSSKQADSILQAMMAYPKLSLAVQLVNAAGFSDTLSNPSKTVTFFAPTNDGIMWTLEAMNITVGEFLGNWELIKKIVPYHIVTSNVNLVGEFPVGQSTTISGTLPTMLSNQYLLWIQQLNTADGSVVRTVRGTESGKADITPSTPVATVKGGSRVVPIDDVLFPVVDE